MAQGYDKYELDNQTGQSFRFALNDILEASATQNSGDNSPNTTNTSYPYQVWVDTTNDIVKIRDAATAGSWYSLYSVDSDGKPTGAVSYGSYSISTNDTAGNGGTTAITVDTSQNVAIGTASAGLKLHVQDGALASAPTPNSNCDVVIEGTTDTGIQFLSSGQTQLRFGDAGSTGAGSIIYSHSTDSLAISANASEAARINSSGQILIGTSSAISGSSSNDVLQLVNSAGAILSVATSDTTIGSGTRIGEIEFWGQPGGTWGKFGGISCFGDTTAASNDNPGRLIFYTTAEGASSPTERMRIDDQGQAKIGTTSGADGLGLEVHSTSNNSNVGTLYARNNNADAASPVAAFATATNSTATSNVLIKFGMNSYASGSGQINANGSGQAAFGFFSDERLKENIVDLPSQWENIKNLRPVEFDYIESQGGEHQIGFIAQEFETVYPDAVASQPMFVGVDEETSEERLTLTGWSKTEARLVKALQEAIAKIETLEAKVAALESA